jgi:hypothetical protein
LEKKNKNKCKKKRPFSIIVLFVELLDDIDDDGCDKEF